MSKTTKDQTQTSAKMCKILYPSLPRFKPTSVGAGVAAPSIVMFASVFFSH